MIATNWDWDNSATSTTPRQDDIVWYKTVDAEPEQIEDLFSDESTYQREKKLHLLSRIGARIAYKRWKQTDLFFLTLLYWAEYYTNKPYTIPCVSLKRQFLSGVSPRNRGRHFDRKFNPNQ